MKTITFIPKHRPDEPYTVGPMPDEAAEAAWQVFKAKLCEDLPLGGLEMKGDLFPTTIIPFHLLRECFIEIEDLEEEGGEMRWNPEHVNN